ncbi:MAG: ComF family protein [Parcubacteria group bacterium]|nr:ComF family protein [Parcubacteria group bacterium]
MHQTIRSSFAGLLDLLFPLACLACAAEGAWLCTACENGIPAILANHCPFCEAKTPFGNACPGCRPRHALDGAISCIPYAHPTVQSLIHAWKYNGVSEVTVHLARFVERSLVKARRAALAAAKQSLESGMSAQGLRRLSAAPPLLAGVDVLLQPIPLHPKREKERGFNQALLLARELAGTGTNRAMGKLLARVKKTSAQAKLSGVDRSTNMAGAFALVASEYRRAAGKHVVVVDDVITTGRTMEEAARLLKNAGAASVWGLTVAYGHPVHA